MKAISYTLERELVAELRRSPTLSLTRAEVEHIFIEEGPYEMKALTSAVHHLHSSGIIGRTTRTRRKGQQQLTLSAEWAARSDDELADQIRAARRQHPTLKSHVEALERRLSSLERRLSSLEGRLSSLEGELGVGDTSLNDLMSLYGPIRNGDGHA